MKRLFTGIAMDSAQLPALAECAATLAAEHRDLRWSDPAGWHVTLQFYGMSTSEQEECLRRQLMTVEAAPFPFAVRDLGLFERAGVLLAQVVANPELTILQQHVTAASRVCGFLPEERPYHPHVTLARQRSRSRRASLQKELSQMLLRYREQPSGSVYVTEFVLYESVAGPSGSRYEVRERFALRD